MLSENSQKTKKPAYRKSDAVKYLEQLAFENARLRHPSVPAQYLAPRTFRDDTANGLTKCIIEFIRLKSGQAERIANMGRVIDNRRQYEDVIGRTRTIGSKKWLPGTGTNGSADISATINGKSVKVEVKIGADRQSQAQKDYQLAIEKAGGLYTIASSFELFLKWYNATFCRDGR